VRDFPALVTVLPPRIVKETASTGAEKVGLNVPVLLMTMLSAEVGTVPPDQLPVSVHTMLEVPSHVHVAENAGTLESASRRRIHVLTIAGYDRFTEVPLCLASSFPYKCITFYGQ
jgi:hypothetical protein